MRRGSPLLPRYPTARRAGLPSLAPAPSPFPSSTPARLPALPAMPKHARTKFYAVRVGRVPGVYSSWEQTSLQVSGYPRAVHRAFVRRDEAERWLAEAFIADGTMNIARTKEDGSSPGVQPPQAAPGASSSSPPPSTGSASPAPPTSLASATTTTLPTLPSRTSGHVTVSIDGSSLSNGSSRARAGIGVFHSPLHPLNASEPLPDHLAPHTNNRAELYAAYRALQLFDGAPGIVLRTDSEYAIKVFREYLPRWKQRGMKRADGGRIENLDLIGMVQGLLDEWAGRGAEVRWEWIRGHSNDPGNEEADRLAKRGAAGVTDTA
ncbi:ribonuclease H-like domain-containing protein [Hyaloraphidium curvatum]|nr:ribonuclease H-like domain-containing protein [Hyaloraphidium curvatum]